MKNEINKPITKNNSHSATEHSRNVPKSWKIKKLGEVCEIKPPKKIAKEKLNGNDFVTFFPMADLKEFDYFITPKQTRKLSEVYNGYVYFENNDVLLAKITPCFENGKLGIAAQLKNGVGFGSSEYIVFRPTYRIISEYIYYFLSLNDIREKGRTRMTGAVGHKRIPVDYIAKQSLPLPPLSEQKRIVSILDKAFDAIDKAKANTEQNLKNAKELFESYLNRVFDPSTSSGQEGDDCDAQSLPKWEEKKLGEVCEKIFAGGDKPKEFSKFMTDEFSVPIFANGEKNKGLYGYTNIARISKPSITISGRGTIGYSEIRTQPFVPIVRLITLLPNKETVDINFLHYGLKNIDFSNSGSSIPQLTVPMVKGYYIPIPPLPEQKRIVSILDKAFEAIDKAKANAEQNLKNAKELFESYLNRVFDPSTSSGQEGNDCDAQSLPKWEEKSLSEITTKIGSGATPRGGKASYKEEGISLVRSMNVHDFEFRGKNLAFIDDKQAEALSNVTLLDNDVLLNITGASIARCCIIPKQYLPARVNQHVSIIRARQDLVSPLFLASLLTSKFYKDRILEIGEQGATRQAITKAQIEKFKISLPKTIDEQKKIVEKINKLSAESIKLEEIYNQKLYNLEELKKSILNKAFNGNL